MPGVSAEQVKLAREVDLLSYLQANEPHELRPPKNGEYRTVTHGSLVISKGKWIWNRGGFGGRTALDYLIKIRGMGFVEAVETVLGSRAAPVSSVLPVESPKPPQPKKLVLPYVTRCATHAFGYLQKRGVGSEVIGRCMKDGLLYEGRYNGAPVCVFVGRDKNGKERFACMRGIGTDLKQDCAGSDKRYSFCFPAGNPNSRHLAVFEAPIDALSHATMQQRSGWEWDGHRLSLGGTSDVALIAFLARNPQITRVILHLDNDAAGIIAARKIKATLAADSRFRHIRVSINPPHRGKDYNEALLHDINLEREQKHQRRREAAISL